VTILRKGGEGGEVEEKKEKERDPRIVQVSLCKMWYHRYEEKTGSKRTEGFLGKKKRV